MTGNKLLPPSEAEQHLRNYAFIDGQVGLKEWKQFRDFLREEHRVKKAYLFLDYLVAQSEHYSFLKNSGYELLFKQRSINVELALQIMIDYRNYDQAVVVSGSGEIVSVVKYLQEHDKLAQLILPTRKSYAGLLQQQPLSTAMITFIPDIPTILTNNTSQALKIQV